MRKSPLGKITCHRLPVVCFSSITTTHLGAGSHIPALLRASQPFVRVSP